MPNNENILTTIAYEENNVLTFIHIHMHTYPHTPFFSAGDQTQDSFIQSTQPIKLYLQPLRPLLTLREPWASVLQHIIWLAALAPVDKSYGALGRRHG